MHVRLPAMQPKPPCCMFQLSMPPMRTQDRLSTCHETPGIGEGLRSGSCRYAFATQELLSSSSPHARMLTNGSPLGLQTRRCQATARELFLFHARQASKGQWQSLVDLSHLLIGQSFNCGGLCFPLRHSCGWRPPLIHFRPSRSSLHLTNVPNPCLRTALTSAQFPVGQIQWDQL